jgi:hypothetical protein
MKTIVTVALALIMVSCNQKPNPPVEWPPMDPSWGYAPDSGDAGHGDAR